MYHTLDKSHACNPPPGENVEENQATCKECTYMINYL